MVHSQVEYQNMLQSFCINVVSILFDPQIVRFDQLMISQALSNKEMSQEHYNRCYLPAIKELTRLIKSGQEKGYLKTAQAPEDIADMLLSSISGLSYTKALFGFSITKEIVEAKVVNIINILFSANDSPVQGLDNI